MPEFMLSNRIIGTMGESDYADPTQWDDARLIGALATCKGLLDTQDAPEEVLTDVNKIIGQLDFERMMRGLEVPIIEQSDAAAVI